MTSIKKALRRFCRDEKGVTLVEYGIAVTLAVVVGTILLANLGGAINANLIEAASCMNATVTTNTTTGAVTGGC